MAKKHGKGQITRSTSISGKYKETAFKGKGTKANPVKSTRIKLNRGRAPRGR